MYFNNMVGNFMTVTLKDFENREREQGKGKICIYAIICS